MRTEKETIEKVNRLFMLIHENNERYRGISYMMTNVQKILNEKGDLLGLTLDDEDMINLGGIVYVVLCAPVERFTVPNWFSSRTAKTFEERRIEYIKSYVYHLGDCLRYTEHPFRLLPPDMYKLKH